MQQRAQNPVPPSTDGEGSGVSHAYLFETKSLQRYIFETGRLHDMVAASALIDALTSGKSSLLDRVVGALPEAQRPTFSRRAGGALAAHFVRAEDFQAFRDAWTLAVQMAAPGLEFVQASGDGGSAAIAARAARAALGRAHNSVAVTLPVAGPLSERASRTGMAAVERSDKDGDLVDLATAAKRHAAAVLFEKNTEATQCMQDPVAARLAVRLEGGALAVWPLNLDREESRSLRDVDYRVVFPYLDGPAYVGIIHADGNGLGQLVMALGAAVEHLADDRYLKVLSEFSSGLDGATHKAVRRATQLALAPHAVDGVLPARPFILGGDDLGIIVRGDCALAFTKAFLEFFEDETEKFIKKLSKDYGEALAGCPLPERLTAAAGIAYVKPHQPFFRAYELAESLCAHAKHATKKRAEAGGLVPSAVAFHRVTTSMIEEYGPTRVRELVGRWGRERYEVSVQPWYVGCRADAGPALDALLELQACTAEPDMSAMRLREVLELIALGRAGEADKRYQRWRDVVVARDAALLGRFDGSLARILGNGARPERSLLGAEVADEEDGEPVQVRATPLADLLTLRALASEEAGT
jgi:hypothetical protein